MLDPGYDVTQLALTEGPISLGTSIGYLERDEFIDVRIEIFF